jgi:hypothetical protein
MRVERRVLPLLVLAAVVIVGVTAYGLQRQVRSRLVYFPESGHLVRDPLLTFFDDHGAVATFGYPLTDAYVDENGTLVQTFQRAKLQLTVRGVELAPIGRELRLGDVAAGVNVASEFEGFYASHGGAAFFGLPLGSVHDENGLRVQDFERARIVRDASGAVYLADLGTVYLAAFPPLEESGQAAIRLRGTPTPPPEIRASISVEHPTVPKDGEQVLYLTVEDEDGNPVAGAKSLAILRYDTASAELELSDTDASGLAMARFRVPPALPGSQVTVEVHVLTGEIFFTVETNYFQWW